MFWSSELLEILDKMAPTKEEELKLRDYNGDVSKLCSAERFQKEVLDVPFSFRRIDAMLYRANFETEINYLMKCFETLEAACDDLRSSRLFMKLLEAVLKTGNRMNVGTSRGQAKAFKLDTLLKLADVKGIDSKTTLVHFVVLEIIRSEGRKIETRTETFKGKQSVNEGLKVVASLSTELQNVKQAASMDSDVLSNYLSRLEVGLEKIKLVLHLEKSGAKGVKFFDIMKQFLVESEREISRVKAEEKRVLGLLKDITEYFHGNASKEEGLFVVVRDFLTMLDDVCSDIGMSNQRTILEPPTINDT